MKYHSAASGRSGAKSAVKRPEDLDERRPADRDRRAGPVPATPRAPAGAHPLLELQARAGNAAVTALVQRQPQGGTAVLADPLDTAQVSHALEFYRRQPGLYTPQVVSDLRTRLGLDAGGIDAELVQAVARFQRDEGSNDPALKVDGMAGPRSAPRLFPSGLSAAGEAAGYGAAAQSDVFDRWEDLGTAAARAQALVDDVNTRLTTASVPTLTVVLYDGDSPQEDGQFDFPTWTMQLNRLLLEQPGLDSDGAGELARTVYHEARHAEQWFWMARLRAGQGYSAAGIAAELGMPARIATAAKGAPIRPGTTEALVASGWFESVYGSGAEHRERVLTRIEAADWALATAECRCKKFPSPANDALRDRAQERLDKLHDQYRDLPEENDAWATEGKADTGVTGTPHPAPVPDVDPCERLRKAGRPVPGGSP